MIFLNDHITAYTSSELEYFIEMLPEWKKRKVEQYKHEGRRSETTFGFLELMRGLNEMHLCVNLAQEFAYNPHGKPFFRDNPNIHFNISHCKNAVGCIIQDTPCGFDIEYIRQPKEMLVRQTMNETEMQAIYSSDNPGLAFTCFWTRKEAILKLKGTGITDGLRDILSVDNLEGIELQTIALPEKGYVYSWAVEKKQKQ